MDLQQIEEKPYASYIKIFCEDENLPELLESLDFIWSKEEGKEALLRAYAIRGELSISYGDAITEAGYGEPDKQNYEYVEYKLMKLYEQDPSLDMQAAARNLFDRELFHHIALPKFEHPLLLRGEDGNYFETDLTGILAHELFHSSDKQVNIAENKAIQARIKWHTMEVDSQFGAELIDLIDVHTNLETIDFDNFDQYYEEILEVVNDLSSNDTFIKKLEEWSQRKADAFHQRLEEDHTLKAGIAKFEAPAIELQNIIMDGIEPPRSTRYDECVDYNNLSWIREHRPEQFKQTLTGVVVNMANSLAYGQERDEFKAELKAAKDNEIDQVKPGAIVLAEKPGALVFDPQMQGRVQEMGRVTGRY